MWLLFPRPGDTWLCVSEEHMNRPTWLKSEQFGCISFVACSRLHLKAQISGSVTDSHYSLRGQWNKLRCRTCWCSYWSCHKWGLCYLLSSMMLICSIQFSGLLWEKDCCKDNVLFPARHSCWHSSFPIVGFKSLWPAMCCCSSLKGGTGFAWPVHVSLVDSGLLAELAPWRGSEIQLWSSAMLERS